MNVAYWLSLITTIIFIWKVLSFTVFPIVALIVMPAAFPVFWFIWLEKPVIGEIKDTVKYIYVHFIMRILLILFCVCVFIILLLYAAYWIAKYILMKELITAPLGKAILDFVVIREFIELGIFPFFDTILSYFFPAMYGGAPTGPIEKAISDFGKSFVEKIKAGDGSEQKKPEPTKKTGTVSQNPNLTEEDNTTVNDKYEKCIEDNMPGAYNDNDPFSILMANVKITNATLKCELQKIKDSMEVKGVK
jgi:hypothetical protein